MALGGPNVVKGHHEVRAVSDPADTVGRRTKSSDRKANLSMNLAVQPDLWAGVDRLIDRAPSPVDLRAHGLQVLAARRLRRELPPEFADVEWEASQRSAVGRLILREARSAYDGPIIVLKGLDTATYYPSMHLRPFADIDLLVEDAERAQRALISSGFVPVGLPDAYYDGLHHLRPLVRPEAPSLAVEIHRRPNWFSWSDPPANDELFNSVLPSALGVPGVFGLLPAQHALVVAAHAWVELPLRRLLDLVDAAAISSQADSDALMAVARRWDMLRVWRTTSAAANALFYNEPTPSSLRVWGRNLEAVRDRTVLETHFRRLASVFWARPPLLALATAGRILAETALPAPSDSWSTKLARTRRAIMDRSKPAAQHAQTLGEDAQRAPRFRRR